MKEFGEVLILVVDDDRNSGEVMRGILKDSGYRAIVCGNGAEAVKLSKVLIPDLILLNLIMPIKNGWTAFKEIHTDPKTSQIKVLLFSSNPRLNGQYQDVDAFMQSPIPPEDLLETIEHLLSEDSAA
jgi:twitching motility two-component system response regulator PilH